MQPFPPRHIHLVNGRDLGLRAAQARDGAAVAAHVRAVGGESDHLNYGAGDPVPTEEVQAAWVAGTREAGGCVLLAELDGAVIGLLSCRRGELARTQHRAELGLSVRRAYWGLGVGRALVEASLQWGRAAGLTRVSLCVRANNPRAIGLYERLGFQHEGRRRYAAQVDGAYLDELDMAIVLHP